MRCRHYDFVRDLERRLIGKISLRAIATRCDIASSCVFILSTNKLAINRHAALTFPLSRPSIFICHVSSCRDLRQGFSRGLPRGLLSSLSAVSANARGGNDLRNMQARALELGGQIDIVSYLGSGTQLTLMIPLKVRRPQGTVSREPFR